LYLVVDPTISPDKLLDAVEKAMKGGVDILQLWKAWQSKSGIVKLAKELLNLANAYTTPLIVNDDLQLAKDVGAYGVHLDGYDVTPTNVRKALGEKSIVGYTVGTDLQWVKWAETVGADYVSFCSVFPTPSAVQCDIVPLNTIQSAKSMARIPIFASGGITLSNAHLVLETGIDGIAVISSILQAEDPQQAAKSFKTIIGEYRSAT
jgi:thiamine-phosphate pyrophosphorylase